MPSAAFSKAMSNINKKLPNVVRDVSVAGQTDRVILDSPRLNYVYGGGVAIGRIHRFYGPESGGKSTICTYIASQFQKKRPEHPYCVYIDFERSFDEEHAKQLGLLTDPEHFVFMQPDDIESAGSALEEMVKTGEVGTIIFDSESMASTRTVMEDEFNKANFGSGAKALKEFCNRFNILCANYGATMFIISQERAQMAVLSRAIATTGGYALRYAASTANRVKKIENLTSGSKIVGIHMNVRNYKNKTGVPWRECEMDLYFDHGFDSNCEYVDFLKEFADDERLKHLVVAGNGGTFKSEKYGWSFRGKENFIDAIKNNQVEGWDEIKTAVNIIISNPIDGKENSVDPEIAGESDAEKSAGTIENVSPESKIDSVEESNTTEDL